METKDYQIISLGEQSLLVVILSLEMMDNYWTTLQSELAQYNIANAEVYFDFLYRNGLKNRFFKTRLMGVSLLNNSLRKCKATQECIIASEKFFALHKDVIEHSVLSSVQKMFFRKKLDKNNVPLATML
jgi:predicted Ser/Thr protein kinase